MGPLVTISNIDLADLLGVSKDCVESVEATIEADLSSFLEESESARDQVRANEREIAQAVGAHWSDALFMLRIEIDLAQSLSSRLRCDGIPPGGTTGLHEALLRLHTQSCVVAYEVLHLLWGGFPGGASARARTVHELVVTTNFLASCNEEVAERFLEHEKVEAFKIAKLYSESPAFEASAPSASELRALEGQYNALLARYGNDFKDDYAWARPALALRGKERPTFRKLEEAIGRGVWRPFYKVGSRDVHVSPRGSARYVGADEMVRVVTSGPITTDLSDAGAQVAVSLPALALPVVRLKPTEQNIRSFFLISGVSRRAEAALAESEHHAHAHALNALESGASSISGPLKIHRPAEKEDEPG